VLVLFVLGGSGVRPQKGVAGNDFQPFLLLFDRPARHVPIFCPSGSGLAPAPCGTRTVLPPNFWCPRSEFFRQLVGAASTRSSDVTVQVLGLSRGWAIRQRRAFSDRFSRRFFFFLACLCAAECACVRLSVGHGSNEKSSPRFLDHFTRCFRG